MHYDVGVSSDPPIPPLAPGVELFTPPADNRRVTDAQNRIIETLRTGLKNMIDRFFDGARDVTRAAILNATLDVYNQGITRGKSHAQLVFNAYVDVLHTKYSVRDPRVEVDVPLVTVIELREAIAARGAWMTPTECELLAQELRIPLAPILESG